MQDIATEFLNLKKELAQTITQTRDPEIKLQLNNMFVKIDNLYTLYIKETIK